MSQELVTNLTLILPICLTTLGAEHIYSRSAPPNRILVPGA